MARKSRPRRRRSRSPWLRRLILALAAIPAAYLLAALGGSLFPVNSGWVEPEDGVTIYLANNGVHVDIVMPVKAAGLDWSKLIDRNDTVGASPESRWVAFGAGERAVYLETPRWRDLKLPVAARALTRGERIVHVEWVGNPDYMDRAIRLRPEEYRRLWAGVRSSFRGARPQLIAHKGYGRSDAFYEGVGHASALNTCNQWVADQLRIAGVETSLWTPFTQGLVWRYRKVGN